MNTTAVGVHPTVTIINGKPPNTAVGISPAVTTGAGPFINPPAAVATAVGVLDQLNALNVTPLGASATAVGLSPAITTIKG